VKVLYDEFGRPFMHGMGYDITELKNTEEDLRQSRDKEQRANHAKSEFLTRTSHELRTPLNIIMGFAEFLIESELDPLNPKHKEYLQDIYSSGKHLLRLIDDVLDLGRVEAGKMRSCSSRTPASGSDQRTCLGSSRILNKSIPEVRVVTKVLA
jgi:signal transduction histidine kinase